MNNGKPERTYRMKNIRLITALALVLAATSTSVNAEVQVKLGQMKADDTTLETGQLSLITNDGFVFSLYGANDSVNLYSNSNVGIGDISQINEKTSLFGVSTGYEVKLTETSSWKISLIPSVGYEWDRRRKDTDTVRAIKNGFKVEVAEREYSTSNKVVAALSLNATYNNVVVSVAYDTEERIMLTVGMSL